MVTDNSNLYKIAREYYNSDPLIRAFVDVHYACSLSRASIVPMQSESWLQSLASATLDFWKVGELFLEKKKDLLVYCDPVEIKTGPGSTASETGYQFEFPELWMREYRQEPHFILNKVDSYAVRGIPVSYQQIVSLSRLRQSGNPQFITPAAFGFGGKAANVQTASDMVSRIMLFRRNLGAALNKLWPDLTIDMYTISGSDVLAECKKAGLVR